MALLRPETRLTRNRNFTVFWAGQTFSFLGDAFSIVAIPLLILEMTGSLAQMGVVTALYGVGSLVAGIAARPIVDRVDRRKLMIRCDIGRAFVYGLSSSPSPSSRCSHPCAPFPREGWTRVIG